MSVRPVPKPPRPAKKPRAWNSTLAVAEAKPRPSKPLARKSPPKKRPRSKSETERVYGAKARIAWVKSLPCVVADCGRSDIENAHVEGDGMGRKAGYDKIVPMCHGHHRLLHSWGVATFQRVCKLDLRVLADLTEARWQQIKGAA